MNEDYLDYWLIHLAFGGDVEVDEKTKDVVLGRLKTLTHHLTGREGGPVAISIQPEFIAVTDIAGGEAIFRADEVRLITHWTPQWRENFRRFEKARDDSDDKKWE